MAAQVGKSKRSKAVSDISAKNSTLIRGMNLPRIGDFNQTVVLDEIRRSKFGVSRVDVIKKTGLSPQTVSNICRRLLDLQLIEEIGKEQSGPGKPRILLRLKPGTYFSVGIHLDPAVVTAVIIDLQGNVLVSNQFQTPAVTSPTDVIARISSKIIKLIEKSGVDQDRILGVGVASPGPINQELGIVLDPPNLAGWHRVPLRERLATALDLPVIIDKDVNAAAIGEIWNSPELADKDFIFYYLGFGVGVGLVVNGEIVRGTTNNAGEIGGFTVPVVGGAKASNTLGNVGLVATPLALVEDAERKGILNSNRLGVDPHSVDLQFESLAKMAAKGNASARDVINEFLKRTSTIISTISNLLDVDQVIIGGPFFPRISDLAVANLPEMIQAHKIVPALQQVRVQASELKEGGTAIGAACLVFDKTFSPRPMNLTLGS